MHYVKTMHFAFIFRNEVEVLDIDVLLIKVSITDGRRLLLHYIVILSFSWRPS